LPSQGANLADQVGLDESALGRQERGGIDYGGRSDFVFLLSLGGSSLFGFGTGAFATARGLAAASRLTAAGGLSATARIGAAAILFLAAALAEDAVKQTDAAALLAALRLAAGVFATASGLGATARISRFATASGLGTAARICTAVVTAFLLVVNAAEQVQQRVTAALLAAAGRVASVFATASGLGTTARISRFATASGLGTTARISASGFAAIIAVLPALAAAEEVQQRCSAALGLAGHALHFAASRLAATAGSWIRTRCVTTGRFVTAPVVIRSEHSVEQIQSEALGAEAEAEHQRSN
jgi:hypothetical protein